LYKFRLKAALWKLQNFEIDSNSYLIYWSELVTLAEAAGVTNLIYDLTGNTGGYGKSELISGLIGIV